MADQVANAAGVADVGGSAREGMEKPARRARERLLPEQERALLLLAEGKSIPKVAETVGVHRATVYRWITADPCFRAAYNAWQLEQRESFRAVLLNSAEKAVERVATMVDHDHQFAWKVAKELGMLRSPENLYTDPRQVEREIEIERLEEEARLEQREKEPRKALAEARSEALATNGKKPDSVEAEPGGDASETAENPTPAPRDEAATGQADAQANARGVGEFAAHSKGTRGGATCGISR
jgi:hypothetical protein